MLTNSFEERKGTRRRCRMYGMITPWAIVEIKTCMRKFSFPTKLGWTVKTRCKVILDVGLSEHSKS
jgi:hypothetical protein